MRKRTTVQQEATVSLNGYDVDVAQNVANRLGVRVTQAWDATALFIKIAIADA